MKFIHSIVYAIGLGVVTLSVSPFVLAGQTMSHKIESESTGIGKESRAMDTENYPLKLVFSDKKTGGYVADVDVDIKDASGKTLLKRKSMGPWLLVKLPQGKYQVIGTRETGDKESTVFSIVNNKTQKEVGLSFG